MKKIIRILTLALVLVMLTGCFGGTKTFTCRELTMTVPSSMKDVSGNRDLDDYTFALDSSKMVIFGLQERYDEYPVLEEYDLKEYAEQVIRVNDLDCRLVSRSTGDYMYFTYLHENDGEIYKYLTGVYQTEEGFWVVQIAATLTKYEETTFFGYLDSVEFE